MFHPATRPVRPQGLPVYYIRSASASLYCRLLLPLAPGRRSLFPPFLHSLRCKRSASCPLLSHLSRPLHLRSPLPRLRNQAVRPPRRRPRPHPERQVACLSSCNIFQFCYRIVWGRCMHYSKCRLSAVFSPIIIFCLLFLIGQSESSYSQNLDGVVVKVKDGDTVVVEPIGQDNSFICRLYGIDAPEISERGKPGQPFGAEASNELKSLIYWQTVNVEITGQGKYRRQICLIHKDNADINQEMVKRGYAWAYVEYLKRAHASEYIDLEREARGNRLGLWKQSNPQPPWEFRESQRQKVSLKEQRGGDGN